jgi:hypothetical protein
MLYAQFFKSFLCGHGASGFHIVEAFTNAGHGFVVLAALPLKCGSQNLIQCDRRILSTPTSIIVQLRLTLG